jgi:hypothetical protein
MDYNLLLTNALLWGSLLSLTLGVIMTASFLIAPDMWVGDYPPDIKAKYGEMSGRARKFRPWIGLLFFGALVIFVILALLRLRALVEIPAGFLPHLWADFLTAFIVLFIFNLFDLLVIDWLLFVRIQPAPIVLPGTEGLAGYQDYAFHFRGFLIGTVFSAVGALVFALGSGLVTAVTSLF